jgi:hypothetical protein
VIPAPGRRTLPEDLLGAYRRGTLLERDEEVLAARRLHADVFVASGFVGLEDVAPDGTLAPSVDPYPGMSTYVGVLDDRGLRATARQIVLPDAADLPALRFAGLDPVEVRRLTLVPASGVTEISALARASGATAADVISVYTAMWANSLRAGHHVWVMGVDRTVFRLLRHQIAGDVLHAIGPTQDYLGSASVPAVLWLDELRPELLRRAAAADAPLTRLLPELFPAPATVDLREAETPDPRG